MKADLHGAAGRIICLSAAILTAAAAVCGCGKDSGAAAGGAQTGSRAEAPETAGAEAPEAAGEAADPDEILTREVFAMDTYMTFSAYGAEAPAALDEAEAEIKRLDALLSAESDASEISKLNASGGGPVSEDTAVLIRRSLELFEKTGGAFEITVYPVKKAWGFADGNFRVPDEAELSELLARVGSDRVHLSENGKEVRFDGEGTEIDLGGIAKGYASSRLADIYREHGVKGLINLGGNVQVFGAKPDGSDWRVGIRTPAGSDGEALPWLSKEASGSAAMAGIEYFGILETNDQAVITSGGYERYFEENGVVYHHIIDPATGYPADTDILSATAVSRDGTLADGLSTSIFVLGREKASELWRENSDSFDMIIMDTDGQVWATEGIRGQFTSELTVRWIEK